MSFEQVEFYLLLKYGTKRDLAEVYLDACLMSKEKEMFTEEEREVIKVYLGEYFKEERATVRAMLQEKCDKLNSQK